MKQVRDGAADKPESSMGLNRPCRGFQDAPMKKILGGVTKKLMPGGTTRA